MSKFPSYLRSPRVWGAIAIVLIVPAIAWVLLRPDPASKRGHDSHEHISSSVSPGSEDRPLDNGNPDVTTNPPDAQTPGETGKSDGGNAAAPVPGGVKLPQVKMHFPLARVPWKREIEHPTPAMAALAQDHGSDESPDDIMPRTGTPHFVMSLCQDLQGRIWVGTEDEGVWCWNPQASPVDQWQHFTRKNTGGPDEPDGATIEAGNWLGDDNGYAIACDKLGRIWVGHLNHGVSVYNGKEWKNYGVLEGPLGERVFAIATCPADGDVWIATSAGLARYSMSKDSWSYYTRAEGVSSDQASAIAFDKDGNIILGTQCDGLSLADVKDNYSTWRHVTCIKEYEDRVPSESRGQGLPTNLINDVQVAKDGTIYVATTTGLAWSKDKGETFEFRRGQDWAEKVKGLYGGPPKGWIETKEEHLLSEDYVTNVSESENGILYLGHWKKGIEAFEQRAQPQLTTVPSPDSYISATYCLRDSQLLIGTYGKGLGISRGGSVYTVLPNIVIQDIPKAAFPSIARPQTIQEFESLQKKLAQVPVEARKVATWSLDWSTQGDWVGRYGRDSAILCAASSPFDHEFQYADSFYVKAHLRVQPTGHDTLRYWIHTPRTNNVKSLYDPILGFRRQAEWDDHGEIYPETMEGPDICVDIKVPAGMHLVSFYFVNKDGHNTQERLRDFYITARGKNGDASAHYRVHDFWNGVYARFRVQGPSEYKFTIARNYCFDVLCSGVFVDQLSDPTGASQSHPLMCMGDLRYERPEATIGTPNTATDIVNAWNRIDVELGKAGASGDNAWVSRRLAYRICLSRITSSQLLTSWRWSTLLWTSEDRSQWVKNMDWGWKEFVKSNPQLNSRNVK